MQLEPVRLENEIVRLEPLREDHREALRPIASDPELWSLSTIRGDGEYFDSWFDHMLSSQNQAKQISHAVVRKTDGAVVGHTAFLSIFPEHARLEIGWTWYDAKARGTQINPACKLLLLERAFLAGGRRVELKTHGLNQRSQNAMLKMGAKKEGVLRQHTKTWRGDWRDTVFFSVLRDEWPIVREGLKARLNPQFPD
ncbi:GNAT family protein [Maricaulis sp.]|uniref:GNAT family N-acetyltransferase n=1 Tax=Maricaulis sp. TaxID=1486257 RepID=UPI0026354EE6|nr:GNAT family protein [Maricaulis sp.]